MMGVFDDCMLVKQLSTLWLSVGLILFCLWGAKIAL
jgi:hypothetical protein